MRKKSRGRKSPCQRGLLFAAFLTLFLAAGIPSRAQSGDESVATGTAFRVVKGQVVDRNQEPLVSVSVVVKGTKLGTITDANGTFSLSVPTGERTLQFSYLGMLPRDRRLPEGETSTSVASSWKKTVAASRR